MGNEAQKEIICLSGGSGEIVVQKSRFLADVSPVKNAGEAEAFLSGIRKKYYDAKHHCYAYAAGEDGLVKKCSDDGEPQRTAGMPIMDIIERQNIKDICIVVTRYFGGILLGTGGLVRAYQAAAEEGLRHSVLAERKTGFLLSYSLDYGLYEKMKNLSERERITVPETVFGERVRLKVLIPEELEGEFLKQVREMSCGAAVPEEKKPVRYCMSGGKVLY